MKFWPLFLGVVLIGSGCSKGRGPDIAGYWRSDLTANGVNLRLGMELTQKPDNTYAATFDSLDQGAREIPVPQVTYAGGVLHLGLPGLGASFEGRTDGRAKQIAGTWKQLGFSAPLVWHPASKPPVMSAAQVNQAYAPRPGSDIQGIWKGTLVIGPTRLRLLFKLSESADGKFSGVLDSVDQGARNIPLTTVSFIKPTLDIEVKQIGGNFNGKLAADAKEIIGDWEQLGRATRLTLTRTEPGQSVSESEQAAFPRGNDEEPQGIWAGVLSVRGTTLRLVFKVARDAAGKLSGTLDSLDQGVRDLPASQVTFTNKTIHMEWQGINGTFDGDLDGGKLDGEWRQMGGSLPLVLQRTNAAPEQPNRK